MKIAGSLYASENSKLPFFGIDEGQDYMTYTKHLKSIALAGTVVLAGGAANATSLGATDSGWYRANGAHSTGNANIFTGVSTFGEHRSFFTFDISALSGTATAATFSVGASTNACPTGGVLESTGCFVSDAGSETVELFDVSTSVASLTGGAAGVAGFTDLGSGNSYGTMTITQGNNTTMPMVSIMLNAFGLADLNAAIAGSSGEFAIGAAVQTLGSSSLQGLWWFSENDPVAPTPHGALDVTTAAIPVPASLPLLVAGLGLMGVAARRRKAS